jgi:hypothetical protein
MLPLLFFSSPQYRVVPGCGWEAKVMNIHPSRFITFQQQ